MYNREIEVAMRQNPNLTVRKLSIRLGIKVRTFYRRWFGDYTPKELIEEKRLEIAKQHLLANCNKKITEIAHELKFCDHYYFSKWFRRKMGVSPQKYRMMSLKERTVLERKRNHSGNGNNGI